MSADRPLAISKREALRLAAGIPLVPIDLALPKLKPEALILKPTDPLAEQIDGDGFYIPRTSLEEARQNLERILAKDPEDITDADMFQAVSDTFASLASTEIAIEPNEPDEITEYRNFHWKYVDEVWLNSPSQVVGIAIGSHNSSEYKDPPREEFAWIEPTKVGEDFYSFQFNRDSNGKVTSTLVNDEDLDEDFVRGTPYEMPPIQKSLFLISLLQEVKSKIPNQS